LTVQVRANTGVPLSTGRSATSSFVANRLGFEVFEQAAAPRARGGPYANGAAADIEIELTPTYLANVLRLDPLPAVRTSAVPDGELTADDVILFISRFTASSPLADIAVPGPSVGQDRELTADDISMYVNRFTTGC